jgi:hypothetical protein
LTTQLVDSPGPPFYARSTMALSLHEIPAVQPDMKPALRSVGSLIITVLEAEPAQAYTPQEILSAVLRRTGTPQDIQNILQGASVALDIAGLFSPGAAEFNEKRRNFWESVLNTLLRDGELSAVMHKGIVYLHVARKSRPTGLLGEGV